MAALVYNTDNIIGYLLVATFNLSTFHTGSSVIFSFWYSLFVCAKLLSRLHEIECLKF